MSEQTIIFMLTSIKMGFCKQKIMWIVPKQKNNVNVICLQLHKNTIFAVQNGGALRMRQKGKSRPWEP